MDASGIASFQEANLGLAPRKAKPISVAAIDSSHTVLFVMDPGLPFFLFRGDFWISLEVSTTFYPP